MEDGQAAGFPWILVIREAALAADLVRKLISKHLEGNYSHKTNLKSHMCLHVLEGHAAAD